MNESCNLLRLFQDDSCLACDALSHWSNDDIPVRSLKQLDSQEVFSLSDLSAQRRLADVTRFRRLSEMPVIRHGDQILQVTKGQGRYIHKHVLSLL